MSNNKRLPNWMEKHRNTFVSVDNSEDSIEELLSADFELEFRSHNYSKAVQIMSVRVQFVLLSRLYDKGLIN